MDRRKFLVGMGSLAAGGAAAIGSGAFDQVSAERTMTVSTAADNNAQLKFKPGVGTNSEYATLTGGEVTVNLDNLNRDATTVILELFEVQNESNEPAVVYVNPDSVKIGGDKVPDNTSDYIDPQASNLPNGSGAFTDSVPIGYDVVSMTAAYIAADGSELTNPPEFKSTADTVFGNGNGVGELKLGPGGSFSFGLYVDEARDDGNGGFAGDVSMEIVGDTNIA